MNTALDIAKHIINRCNEDGRPINNLQLNCMLYILRQRLLREGKHAFFDDFKARQFGPVVPNVYYHFCHYAAMPIEPPYPYPVPFVRHAEIIYAVIEENQRLPIWKLLCKCKDAFWQRAWNSCLAGGSDIIKFNNIKKEKTK